ncbi:MAG TPA: phytanoyl-CoA dioxygenase family protein [Acidobacteriaceae bacterium]|nr:phytanoyl-CoA dioxygenase family protein [Acidobacteriaceae bacterium]
MAVATEIQTDLNGTYSLSSKQLEQYRANGYIKLKHVLSPETLAYYRREISRKVRELNTEHLPLEERDLYHRAFLQIENLWPKSEIVREFISSPKLGRIAAQLMGTTGVRIYHDQALYKEAGGGITPWHADQYYWPVDSDKTITAWIPLQATPLEMGPLAFCPKSHRVTSGRDLEIGQESEERIGAALKDHGIDEEGFELGEVSFHAGWTFHRAAPNTTPNPREVMTIIYMDEDMRLTEPVNKYQQDDRTNYCPGIAVGDIINSPMNPVTWSSRS